MSAMNVFVKIKRCHPAASVPRYQHSGDAGFDFHLVEEVQLEPDEIKLVRTGLCFQIPYGFELQVRSRSGLSKKGVVVANSPGTVDAGFRDEVCILLHNRSKVVQFFELGSRVAQGVVAPVVKAEFEEVSELSQSSRGLGGFGSTGV